MLLQSGFKSRDIREQFTADLSAGNGSLAKMEEAMLATRAEILRKCGFPNGLDVVGKGHSEGKQGPRGDS